MESTELLANFFRVALANETANATHVSLFISIFKLCSENGFASPVSTSRQTLMAMAKIKSIATYHKNMAELVKFEYILYSPSYHPGIGSYLSINPALFTNSSAVIS